MAISSFTKAACGITLLCLFLGPPCAYYGPDLIDNLLMPRPPPPEESSGRPRAWGPFKDEDCGADGSVSQPYKVEMSSEALAELHQRLQQWRPPGALMDHAGSWEYGIDFGFMIKLVSRWRGGDYDWRKYEAQLNTVGLSETVVDGLKIRMHNIKRGGGKKAVLLLHGWPGSVWEFQRIIEMMQHQEVLDEFSIVCPSLPGYGFSSAPKIEGYNTVAMAGTMTRLMDKLGYEQYIVQGGDWGSFVGQSMAYLNPPGLMGLHLNFFPTPPSPGHFLSDQIKIWFQDDEDSQERARKSQDLGLVLSQTGYMHQQATKPETLGYSLSDSPVGMCAWITEKFQGWSDQSLPLEEKFSLDDLITNCMIYWVTNSITSSMRLYKEQVRTSEGNAVDSVKVTLPVALSLFPHEIFPAADTPTMRKYQNVLLYRKHEVGGHFAALEHPDLLLDDLVEFVRKLNGVPTTEKGELRAAR